MFRFRRHWVYFVTIFRFWTTYQFRNTHNFLTLTLFPLLRNVLILRLFQVLKSTGYKSKTKVTKLPHLPHTASSDPSPQSSSLSHCHAFKMHLLFAHENSLGLHERIVQFWFSSEPSPQSSWISQTKSLGIHRELLHWNSSSWQPSGGRVAVGDNDRQQTT